MSLQNQTQNLTQIRDADVDVTSNQQALLTEMERVNPSAEQTSFVTAIQSEANETSTLAQATPPLTNTIEPPLISQFTQVDTTTNVTTQVNGTPFSGPVSGIQNEYINITADSLNITTTVPNAFIHTGFGTDAIDVSKAGGTNVLDGGTGSNFLTGGSGTDTFFVDDRGPSADIWDTVVGFHAGDSATIWGVTPQDFGLAFVDGQGAAGFTGLTLHATATGKPTASLTLAGFTQADIASGRLSISFGTDPASGSAFMLVHGNS